MKSKEERASADKMYANCKENVDSSANESDFMENDACKFHPKEHLLELSHIVKMWESGEAMMNDKRRGIMNKEKLVWYILDEIAVKHSASHSGSGNRPCPICDRATEAMGLLTKPTHYECEELYKQRRGTVPIATIDKGE